MGAAKTAKKKPVKKKPAKKKQAKKKLAKKKPQAAKAAAAMMPRREDIPGIAADLPDFAEWRGAARALKVSPFYAGPGAVPFGRLRATQILDQIRQKTFNEFYLA